VVLEFSIATEDTAGSNPLNPIQQYYAIKEAKEKTDYVLVIVHGGHELWQLPSPRMVETYRFFIDAGADAVVNHHQHCYSGYEVYNGKPIFYGLGNFCFDKQNYFEGLWEYGYMVSLSFNNDVTFDIIPYEQCKDETNVKPLVNRSSFEKRVNELNEIISDRNRLIEKTTEYYMKSIKSIHFAFEPYNGKLWKKLYSMGLLPNWIKKQK
jgi:poly-gamma-glutamate synthesis protein (capsule biosynthesis protein)